MAYINFALVLFNLIPGFPLDSGRVFRAFVWAVTKNMSQATLIAANVGRFFGFLFIFVGVWRMFSGDFGGLWIAFIGWFLDNAASAQAISPHCVTVPADLTLQQLVDEHVLGTGRRCFLVSRGADTVGLMTLHRIKEVPRPDRGQPHQTVSAGQIGRAQALHRAARRRHAGDSRVEVDLLS